MAFLLCSLCVVATVMLSSFAVVVVVVVVVAVVVAVVVVVVGVAVVVVDVVVAVCVCSKKEEKSASTACKPCALQVSMKPGQQSKPSQSMSEMKVEEEPFQLEISVWWNVIYGALIDGFIKIVTSWDQNQPNRFENAWDDT